MKDIDKELDELITELRSGTINFDNEAKQAIKQLINQAIEMRHSAEGCTAPCHSEPINPTESEVSDE